MWRKRVGWIVVCGALAAACTGSDDGDDGATPSDASTGTADASTSGTDGGDDTSADTSADTSDNTSDDTSDTGEDEPGTSTTTTVPEIPVTPLPGLIDDSNRRFPNDRAVRTGTLDNGLTYYVRFNDQPGTRASLRLAIDAGSVDELDDATGVAHFAEHMLFNGTSAYPENQLIDVLRSFGADFGPDINAYTSYDETVYQLEVPNDDATLDEALNVLAEWLSNATIARDQVVAERGVVLDEWRVRTQTASGRLFEVAQGLYLEGTPYASRSPIGTADDIEAMRPATLRAFYGTWYRPEHAAIVVAGDVDVDDMVRRIRQRFGDVAAEGPSTSPAEEYRFPIDTEPDVAFHLDPDQATVDVEVTLPLPAMTGHGTRARRASLIDDVIFDALVRRLDRDVAAGVAPFDQVVPGSNSLVDQLDAPALYAITDAARVGDTLDALLLEYERAFRHGFTRPEVDAAVASVSGEWDAFLGRENEIQDAGYAGMLVANFLDGRPYPTVRDEYDLVVAELDAITPEAVATRFAARWTNSAPHVIISAPEEQADAMPSRDDVLAAIAALPAAEIEPRVGGRDLPDELMERPAPVGPTDRRPITDFTWSQLDPVAYTFPNGARVVLNPNTISQGSVFVSAASPGGSSLVDDADVVDALYAADIVTRSGVADFNQAEFAEIVSTGTAELDASIGVYQDTFEGTSSTADAETLFRMIHLYMTAPRADEVALNQVARRERPLVLDPSIDPRTASWDALQEERYGKELRYAVLPTPDQFDTLDLDGVRRVWSERFGSASDWVFVVSGDLDRAQFETLAAAYIGTLPGNGAIEGPVDVSRRMPRGIERAQVRAGSGDTASVEMLFSTPIDEIDPRNDAVATLATAVLDARLTKVVREEFGDSYSPFIRSTVTADPDPVVETYVFVTGAPDRIDAIAATVIAQIDDIAGGGLGDQEYANAYAPVKEDYGFVDNGEYLRELLREMLIPGYDFDAYRFEVETFAEVDQSDVVDFIGTHIPTDRYVQVTRTPR